MQTVANEITHHDIAASIKSTTHTMQSKTTTITAKITANQLDFIITRACRDFCGSRSAYVESLIAADMRRQGVLSTPAGSPEISVAKLHQVIHDIEPEGIDAIECDLLVRATVGTTNVLVNHGVV